METRDEVQRLLLEGLKPVEVSARLRISKPAVSKHIKSLRAEGRLPEVLPAHQNGGVPKPPPGPNKGSFRPGNRVAMVTGEYETLWDAGLSEREQLAFRDAWKLPTLEQINRQLGLTDVRIGRTLERLRQYREALANGVEMQLDTRSQTDGSIGSVEMNTTTDRMVHTREIIERTELALDRMTQSRGSLLAKRAAIEIYLLKKGLSDGPGGERQNRTPKADLSQLSDEELNSLEAILTRTTLA